jgi:hypothetical protein
MFRGPSPRGVEIDPFPSSQKTCGDSMGTGGSHERLETVERLLRRLIPP